MPVWKCICLGLEKSIHELKVSRHCKVKALMNRFQIAQFTFMFKANYKSVAQTVFALTAKEVFTCALQFT